MFIPPTPLKHSYRVSRHTLVTMTITTRKKTNQMQELTSEFKPYSCKITRELTVTAALCFTFGVTLRWSGPNQGPADHANRFHEKCSFSHTQLIVLKFKLSPNARINLRVPFFIAAKSPGTDCGRGTLRNGDDLYRVKDRMTTLIASKKCSYSRISQLIALKFAVSLQFTISWV